MTRLRILEALHIALGGVAWAGSALLMCRLFELAAFR
jgi:hypothetical protein